MKWFNNNWIYLLLFVSASCVIANAILFYFYRIIFGGAISNELSDWNLFILAFNGFITAILTFVNTCVFVKMNTSIENNNKNRHIKGLLFETQGILAKMRFGDFEQLQELINDIRFSIRQRELSAEKINLLKNKLIKMDNSFLYKNQNFQDEPFLRTESYKLVSKIDKFLNKIKENRIKSSEEENIVEALDSFLNLVEFYILSQLVRGKEVERYISKHQDEIDCTISCIYDFAKEVSTKMEMAKN